MACLLAVSIDYTAAEVMLTLLVLAPADTLVFQKVNNSRDVRRDVDHVIVIDTIVIARYGSGVVGHRGMRHSKLVGKTDTLLRQRSQVGVSNGEVIVGVLEPDDCDAVKCLALHPVLSCKPLSS